MKTKVKNIVSNSDWTLLRNPSIYIFSFLDTRIYQRTPFFRQPSSSLRCSLNKAIHTRTSTSSNNNNNKMHVYCLA